MLMTRLKLAPNSNVPFDFDYYYYHYYYHYYYYYYYYCVLLAVFVDCSSLITMHLWGVS